MDMALKGLLSIDENPRKITGRWQEITVVFSAMTRDTREIAGWWNIENPSVAATTTTLSQIALHFYFGVPVRPKL